MIALFSRWLMLTDIHFPKFHQLKRACPWQKPHPSFMIHDVNHENRVLEMNVFAFSRPLDVVARGHAYRKYWNSNEKTSKSEEKELRWAVRQDIRKSVV